MASCGNGGSQQEECSRDSVSAEEQREQELYERKKRQKDEERKINHFKQMAIVNKVEQQLRAEEEAKRLDAAAQKRAQLLEARSRSEPDTSRAEEAVDVDALDVFETALGCSDDDALSADYDSGSDYDEPLTQVWLIERGLSPAWLDALREDFDKTVVTLSDALLALHDQSFLGGVLAGNFGVHGLGSTARDEGKLLVKALTTACTQGYGDALLRDVEYLDKDMLRRMTDMHVAVLYEALVIARENYQLELGLTGSGAAGGESRQRLDDRLAHVEDSLAMLRQALNRLRDASRDASLTVEALTVLGSLQIQIDDARQEAEDEELLADLAFAAVTAVRTVRETRERREAEEERLREERLRAEEARRRAAEELRARQYEAQRAARAAAYK